MTVDDLQDLYGELRGSRSAPAITDARAHFLERQWQDALACLTEAYETYCESRQRILRQDPEKQVDAKAKDRDRQVRRLKRKQDKARELIERFEDYLPQLKKLAEKERARDEAKEKVASEHATSEESKSEHAATVEKATDKDELNPLRKDMLDDAVVKQFENLIGDRQLAFISGQFDFCPLQQITDVVDDAVYLLRKGDRGFLLHASPSGDDDSRLHCVDLNNAKNHVELSRAAMVKLSQQRKLVLLLIKPDARAAE